MGFHLSNIYYLLNITKLNIYLVSCGKSSSWLISPWRWLLGTFLWFIIIVIWTRMTENAILILVRMNEFDITMLSWGFHKSTTCSVSIVKSFYLLEKYTWRIFLTFLIILIFIMMTENIIIKLPLSRRHLKHCSHVVWSKKDISLDFCLLKECTWEHACPIYVLRNTKSSTFWVWRLLSPWIRHLRTFLTFLI